MTIELTIRDNDGNVVVQKQAEATIPTELRFLKPLLDGKFELWSVTYQPHVRIRDNWIALQQAGLI